MSKILKKETLKEANSFHVSQMKTNVEAIITAELVDGQSIDNRIDTLITAAGGISEATFNAALNIGTANSEEFPFILNAGQLNSAFQSAGRLLTTKGTTSWIVTFSFSLPLNRAGLKLYLKNLLVGIELANAGDYLDIIYVFGWTDHDSRVIIYTCGDDKTAADEVDYAADDGASNFPYDLSGYRYIMVYIGVVANSDSDFRLTYVLGDAYYDT